MSVPVLVVALALLQTTAGPLADEAPPIDLAKDSEFNALNASVEDSDRKANESGSEAPAGTVYATQAVMGPVPPPVPTLDLPPIADEAIGEAIEASRLCFHSSEVGRFCSRQVVAWLNITRTWTQTHAVGPPVPEWTPAEPTPPSVSVGAVESQVLDPSVPRFDKPHEPLPPPEFTPSLTRHAGARDNLWAAVAVSLIPLALGVKLAAFLGQTLRARRSQLRDEVMDAVADAPGIRHAELVRRIGRGNGSIEHHVGQLIRAGRAFRVQRFGATCYFPASFPGKDALALASVAGGTSRRVARAVLCTPGISLVELAQDLAISKATAHYHVEKLVNAGLLDDCKTAGRRRLRISASALPTLGLAYLAK